MDVKPIKTEDDYEAALAEIEDLMDAEPGTEASDRLDVLATLTEAYERQHHPIEAPDPIEALRHALEAKGMSERELPGVMDVRRERAWEILNRRRRLTLPMIRRLHEQLAIPAEILIRPYELEKPVAAKQNRRD